MPIQQILVNIVNLAVPHVFQARPVGLVKTVTN
jgi:hypothetical protein